MRTIGKHVIETGLLGYLNFKPVTEVINTQYQRPDKFDKRLFYSYLKEYNNFVKIFKLLIGSYCGTVFSSTGRVNVIAYCRSHTPELNQITVSMDRMASIHFGERRELFITQ